jgi:hypothetical protein
MTDTKITIIVPTVTSLLTSLVIYLLGYHQTIPMVTFGFVNWIIATTVSLLILKFLGVWK